MDALEFRMLRVLVCCFFLMLVDLWIAGVMSVEETNLALGKPAYQSTTAYDGHASRAVGKFLTVLFQFQWFAEWSSICNLANVDAALKRLTSIFFFSNEPNAAFFSLLHPRDKFMYTLCAQSIWHWTSSLHLQMVDKVPTFLRVRAHTPVRTPGRGGWWTCRLCTTCGGSWSQTERDQVGIFQSQFSPTPINIWGQTCCPNNVCTIL